MKGGEAGEREQGRVRERLLFHQYFIVKVERSEREGVGRVEAEGGGKIGRT